MTSDLDDLTEEEQEEFWKQVKRRNMLESLAFWFMMGVLLILFLSMLPTLYQTQSKLTVNCTECSTECNDTGISLGWNGCDACRWCTKEILENLNGTVWNKIEVKT
jgi:hypothetical protein